MSQSVIVMSNDEILRKSTERILQLISLAFAVSAINAIAFAYNDNSMVVGGIVLIVIAAVLFLLSKRIARSVVKA